MLSIKALGQSTVLFTIAHFTSGCSDLSDSQFKGRRIHANADANATTGLQLIIHSIGMPEVRSAEGQLICKDSKEESVNLGQNSIDMSDKKDCYIEFSKIGVDGVSDIAFDQNSGKASQLGSNEAETFTLTQVRQNKSSSKTTFEYTLTLGNLQTVNMVANLFMIDAQWENIQKIDDEGSHIEIFKKDKTELALYFKPSATEQNSIESIFLNSGSKSLEQEDVNRADGLTFDTMKIKTKAGQALQVFFKSDDSGASYGYLKGSTNSEELRQIIEASIALGDSL